MDSNHYGVWISRVCVHLPLPNYPESKGKDEKGQGKEYQQMLQNRINFFYENKHKELRYQRKAKGESEEGGGKRMLKNERRRTKNAYSVVCLRASFTSKLVIQALSLMASSCGMAPQIQIQSCISVSLSP